MLLTARNLKRYRPMFVVNRRTALNASLAECGIPCEVIETPRLIDGFRPASVRQKFKRLREMIRHSRAVLRVARRWEAEILHCQDAAEAVTVGMAARIAGLPVILQVRGGPRRPRFGFIHLLAAVVASRIIFNAEPLRTEYVAAAPRLIRGWLLRRSVAIPNGLDFMTIDAVRGDTERRAREDFGLPWNSYVLTVVGPFSAVKNQLLFIERAAEQLLEIDSNVTLVFVGSDRVDPSYAKRCRTLVRGLRRGRQIRVLGSLPHARMWSVYEATDVLLIPSVREGLPRVALEAQACGVPVVGTNIAGNVAAIVDGETGFLVDQDCLEGFVSTVRKLRDPALYNRLSRAAEHHARQSFDVERVTRLMEIEYDSLSRQGS